MSDPTYALIFVLMLGALVTAMAAPAPTRAADDEDAIQLWLQCAGCVAVILMGILALSARPAESMISGAVAWLLVMPCVWLSRAPGDAERWYELEEDEDDDGGGSPSPQRPSDPPAPDDRLPGLQPPAVPAARAAWAAGSAQPAPVLATAARVQLLLAAQEAQRAQAAQEVQRLLAAAAGMSLPQPAHATPAEPIASVLPLPQPADALAPDPSALGAPLHRPDPHELRPAPRLRADHRSIAHALAAVAHARTRARASAEPARRQPAAR